MAVGRENFDDVPILIIAEPGDGLLFTVFVFAGQVFTIDDFNFFSQLTQCIILVLDNTGGVAVDQDALIGSTVQAVVTVFSLRAGFVAYSDKPVVPVIGKVYLMPGFGGFIFANSLLAVKLLGFVSV